MAALTHLFCLLFMIYLVSFYVFYSAIIICDVQPPIILLAISLKCKTILAQKARWNVAEC